MSDTPTPKSTILVLDDEPDILDGVRDLVDGSMEECRVIPASSCLEGLQVLARATVDAIVVDFRMPHLNGFDFIERARRLEPGLPIVLMSAYYSTDLAAKAVDQYHVQGVLQKPLDPFEFTETLRTLVASDRKPRIPPMPSPRKTQAAP